MADSKLTDLTAQTSVTTDDLVYVVNDPGGTPASKKVTFDNLQKSITTVSTSLTGVLRADSGVLSADTDVTDIVTSASASAQGKVELATTAETETGTDATRAVTPKGLHDMATLSGAAWMLDEDDLVSDSAVKVPSQQSVKAYVSAAVAAGVSDGDKGDVTVSSSGTVWTVDNDAITYAKIQNVSATDKVLGRSTAGAGDIEEIACTSTARSILDDTSIGAVRTTIGVGTGDSPEFTAINVGHASDSTITRVSAGVLAIEGSNILTAATGQPLDSDLTTIAGLTATTDNFMVAASSAWASRTPAQARASLAIPEVIIIAVSDETTALTTGNGKVTFRMPYAMTVTEVRSSVTTAPTGSTLIVDINESGSTTLSTKLSIDASEKTSTTAASAAVISDASWADDAEMTIDIDQVGSTIAGAGLKVYIIGKRT